MLPIREEVAEEEERRSELVNIRENKLTKKRERRVKKTQIREKNEHPRKEGENPKHGTSSKNFYNPSEQKQTKMMRKKKNKRISTQKIRRKLKNLVQLPPNILSIMNKKVQELKNLINK